MSKKFGCELTALALSSLLAASAAAQDNEQYHPPNPALESSRFHTGPEFSFTPVVGLEFSGPYLAAVTFGEQLCATAEPDDPVSLCVGGTYNPVRMTFTNDQLAGTPRNSWDVNEEGFPQLTVASPIDRVENESLGMLYGNVRFHFLPGDPSVDLDLGIAASYVRRRTQEVIDSHQQAYRWHDYGLGQPVGGPQSSWSAGPSIEEVIETAVPFIGLEACDAGQCLGLRWGLDATEGGTLTQVLYGVRWE